jgi:hypothetical protein
MTKQKQGVVIDEIQKDPSKIIVSNPIAVLKFQETTEKRGVFIPVPTQKIGLFIPKIVWEVVSLLSNTDFDNVQGNTISKRIYIKDFLQRIRGDEKNYRYVIDAARMLRYWEIASINEKGQEVYRGFFNEVIHDKKTGFIDVEISVKWAKELLNIAINGNVSFLKQYVFDLQNSHAINLYPTLKAHAYKGKFERSVNDFKIQFGYNTSGYTYYSNLQKYVIDPAIEEINKKSDLEVVFQPDGMNIDGKRPRITDLIFRIKDKSKEKKPIEIEEEHTQTVPKAPQPQATPTEPKIKIVDINKPKTTTDKPSEADLLVLGDKLKLNQSQIQVIISELKGDYIRAFEVLQGCINEGKTKTINSNFAYIIKSIDTLGVGLYQQEQTKAKKKEIERIEKEKQSIIQKIQIEYEERKKNQFLKLYGKATDQEKAQLLEHIRETKTIESLGVKRNFYINKETQNLNEGGQILAGGIISDENGGQSIRQNKYRNETFDKYGYQISYDDKDQVIILGLFENVEQPPATIEPPQATAPQEPTRTEEQVQENKKRYQAQKRQAKTVATKTTESQATEKTPPAPATIQELTKNEQPTEKPKQSFFQKLFG